QDAERAGIRAIVETFQEQPKPALLAAPVDVLTAPAPVLLERIPIPWQTLVPRAPQDIIPTSLMAGPQAPPLAGPCLPPHFQAQKPKAPVRARTKRPIAPAWILSFVAATAVLLGGGALIQYLTLNRDAKAAAVTSETSPAAAHTAVNVVQEHPLARFVEVAGVRVTTGATRKPQLQYIVINHSAGELTGMALRIAVRSAGDAADAPPRFTVSTAVPALAPNQSKEFRTDIEAPPGSKIPEWQ